MPTVESIAQARHIRTGEWVGKFYYVNGHEVAWIHQWSMEKPFQGALRVNNLLSPNFPTLEEARQWVEAAYLNLMLNLTEQRGPAEDVRGDQQA